MEQGELIEKSEVLNIRVLSKQVQVKLISFVKINIFFWILFSRTLLTISNYMVQLDIEI